MIRPRRFARRLAGLASTRFEVSTSSGRTFNDDTIRSITTSHGKPAPGGGIQASTATIALSTAPVVEAGLELQVRLTEEFADQLAAHLGILAPSIRDRFTGRVGPSKMDDSGRGRSTSVTASSWIALASTSPVAHDLMQGTSIPLALRELIQPSYLAGKIPLTTFGDSDYLATNLLGATYANTAGQLTADIGILLRPTRAGGNHLLPMPYRRDRALAQLTQQTAIGRRQALSPTTWELPRDLPGDEYRVQFVNADGVVITQTTSPTGEPTGTALLRDLDWTHVRFYTEQWQHMYALRAQAIDWAYTIPRLSFDLIELVNSPIQWDRDVAAMLLQLEAGDHVYLGGDWPPAVQGIYFAEGLSESVTGSEWRLDLSLAPYYHVVGSREPQIPALYWDQAHGIWDDYTTETWEDMA